MMEKMMKLFLFGDQSSDITKAFQALLYSGNDPILNSFFTRSYEAIRSEFSKLPHARQLQLGSSSNLADLLALSSNCSCNFLLSHFLTTVYQLGTFIHYCSSHLGGLYPHPASSYVIGMCTGSLAAVAVGSCRTLSELLPVAVRTSLISYRAGLLAEDVKMRFQMSEESLQTSWSIMHRGIPSQHTERIISDFSKRQGLPLTSQPYLSSCSAHGTTISGPPSSLRLLQNSEELKHVEFLQLPIFAPYHAPHLYSTSDLDMILHSETVETADQDSLSINLPILSSTTGNLIWANTFSDLARIALSEIFLKPVNWESMVEGVKSALKISQVADTLLISISTTAGSSLRAALMKEARVEVQVQDLTVNFKATSPVTSGPNPLKSKIAVIGASGRFPGAEDMSAFWDVLYLGLDVHKVVPALRWDVKTHVDISGMKKNTSATPFGCWLENPGLFDAKFFGISPKEAPQIDPAQRLALLTTYEAIEQAGLVPDESHSTRRSRVGVYFGCTSNDWIETNSAQDINAHFIPGGNRAFIPGRINYYFKFSGPSYSVDTACSSSLAAIHIACNSLWLGDIDCAIAGGTNVLTNPDFTSGLDRGHFLSRTGNCKTFDNTADGYCRGEGVATVILKRLEDALMDNDPIQAVILSASTNHSAEAESITRPFKGAQKAIFQNVLSGLDPFDVSYIEMHGTGTQTGDLSEMSSVLDSFAPDSGLQRSHESQQLFLGSAKANVGHGEAASGVTSLIKLLLMMRHNTIPPHCGIKTQINLKFPQNLSARGVHIAKQPVKWDRPSHQSRRALINNFSAAGGNSALLIEDGPKSKGKSEDPRSSHLVAISAKTNTSLTNNVQALLSFIRSSNGPPISLASLAYTTTARRIHYAHRICITGSTIDEIETQLSNNFDRKYNGHNTTSLKPTIAFAFTGQGTHYIGMGRELFYGIQSFRANILRYDFLATSQGFPSILPLITKTTADTITMCPVSLQLAISCLQMALVSLWKLWGIVPRFVLGHSLGFYVSLTAAGVLSEADTIFLVGTRAQILQNKCRPDTHLMLAVKLSLTSLSSILKDAEVNVEIACINTPTNLVLSGKRFEIEKIQRTLGAQGIKAIVLRVPYAFHSSQVDCVLEEFETAVRGVSFYKPCIPVVSPMDSTVIFHDGVFGPKYLADHCRKCVDMVGAVNAATSSDILKDGTIFLEIGPQATVCGMLQEILQTQCIAVPSLEISNAPWKVLTNALSILYAAGSDINWKEYHRDFTHYLEVLPLPAYKWDLKDYWIRYVNDWSLKKGDPIPESDGGAPRPLAPTKRKLDIISTTIHRVVQEDIIDGSGIFAVLSDLCRPDLHRLVQGHRVNGISLCTPSVYADIALSVGSYLRNQFAFARPEQNVNIYDLNIEKALVIQSSGQQLLRTLVRVDSRKKDVQCQFSTVNIEGEVLATHATCVIIFQDTPNSQWQSARSAEAELQIQSLKQGLETGGCYRFNKSMIYRMVGTLAEFDVNYRGLKEIILDSNRMEAFSTVSFTHIKQIEGDSFHARPAYIDAFSQTGGFIMNANENSDLDVEVFVNHGWKSLRIFEKISLQTTYVSYVKMVSVKNRLWEGDLIVLDGKRVVLRFEGLKLQGVPKRLLHSILQSASKGQSQMKNQEEFPLVGMETKPTATSDHTSTKRISLLSNSLPKTRTHEGFIEEADQNTPYVSSTTLEIYISKVMQIVSEESELEVSEFSDTTVFSDIGIDSLLSLIIASRLKEELNFDLKAGVLLFDEFATVGDLKKGAIRALQLGYTSGNNSSSPNMASHTTPSHTSSPLESDDQVKSPANDISPGPPNLSDLGIKTDGSERQASSILLQRSSFHEYRILFLFPDGSGSASSYAKIPIVNDNLTIFGLNCPYIKDAEQVTFSLDSLITKYLTEIKKRQKRGPYSLGGWSTGGILAYEATRRLYAEKEEVEHLLLIDSPPPTGLDRLPQRFYDHCNEIGIFGQITSMTDKQSSKKSSTPSWLIPHFNAMINLLHTFSATPLPIQAQPQVSIYWAGECAFDGVNFPKLAPHVDDTEGMKFLSEKRKDFTAGEWEVLIPGGQVLVTVANGADHFSMMYGEKAKGLAKFIDQATK